MSHSYASRIRLGIPPAGWAMILGMGSVLAVGWVFADEIRERGLAPMMRLLLLLAGPGMVALMVVVATYRERLAEEPASRRRRSKAFGGALKVALAVGLPMLVFVPFVLSSGGVKPHQIGTVVILSLAVQLILPRLYLDTSDRDRAREDQYKARLDQLATSAGVKVGSLIVLSKDEEDEDPVLNAAVHGVGPSRQMILTADLFEALEPNEVDAVVAHELGHLRESHVPLQILVLGALQVGVSYSSQASSGPVAVAFIVLIVSILPLNYAFSRYCEFRADRLAARWVDPISAASALRKITTGHMRPGWMRRLLSTHPEPPERIRRLEGMSV